jgi:hypothetical protein
MPFDEFRDKSAAATVAHGFSAAELPVLAARFGGFIGVAASSAWRLDFAGDASFNSEPAE